MDVNTKQGLGGSESFKIGYGFKGLGVANCWVRLVAHFLCDKLQSHATVRTITIRISKNKMLHLSIKLKNVKIVSLFQIQLTIDHLI